MAKKLKTVAVGTGLINWPGPKHKTVILKEPLNIMDLMKQAQRLAVDLGPDHSRVKLLRRQIQDMKAGIVKRKI